jgi:hypothetical protein
VCIGLSAPVRSVGVFVAPALVIWVAAAVRTGRLARLAAAGAVAIGVAIPLGWYLVAQHAVTHTWALTRTTGETLYARTAIFANCTDFTPPPGTRVLCQPPRVTRPGPTWYMFSSASPMQQHFGVPPDPSAGAWAPDAKLESFALAAIVHQPWAYVWTTLQGLSKYVDPSAGTPSMLEWPQDTLLTQLRNPTISAQALAAVLAYYPRQPTVSGNMAGLDTYARTAKIEGPVTAVLLLLAIIGVMARSPVRRVAWLYTGATAVMFLAPAALLFYGARYATPAYGPLAAAGAFGLDVLTERVIAYRADRDRQGSSTLTTA